MKQSSLIVILLIIFGCDSNTIKGIEQKQSMLYSIWLDAKLDTTDLSFINELNEENWSISAYEQQFGRSELWSFYFSDSSSLNGSNILFRKAILMDYLIGYAYEKKLQRDCSIQADQIIVKGIPIPTNEVDGETPVVVNIGLNYGNVDTLLPYMIINGREWDTVRYDLRYNEFLVKKIQGMDSLEAEVFIYNRSYNDWLSYPILTITDW